MLAETSITNTRSEPCDWRRTVSRPHCGPAAPSTSSASAPSRSASPIRRACGSACASSAWSGRGPTSVRAARRARSTARHSINASTGSAASAQSQAALSKVTRESSWRAERPGGAARATRPRGRARRRPAAAARGRGTRDRRARGSARARAGRSRRRCRSACAASPARKNRPPVRRAISTSGRSSTPTFISVCTRPSTGSSTVTGSTLGRPTRTMYTLTPSACARSAAVSGSIAPRLFSPSVSSTTTLLGVRLSRRRWTAVASPMPIAVPSSASPKSSPLDELTSVSWSSVSGHCVNAVPAKPTMPIRSCGRPRTNSRAVARATSRRVPPPMSLAFMLREMSIASTMSTPRESTSLCWMPCCGRAAATIASREDHPRQHARELQQPRPCAPARQAAHRSPEHRRGPRARPARAPQEQRRAARAAGAAARDTRSGSRRPPRSRRRTSDSTAASQRSASATPSGARANFTRSQSPSRPSSRSTSSPASRDWRRRTTSSPLVSPGRGVPTTASR